MNKNLVAVHISFINHWTGQSSCGVIQGDSKFDTLKILLEVIFCSDFFLLVVQNPHILSKANLSQARGTKTYHAINLMG